MRKFLILLGVLLPYYCLNSNGQTYRDTLFSPPLNIPLFLAGNYGELRSGHFHAGLDMKTDGEPGKEVFAAQDGYVSRIKVQLRGYGRALYITHSNGYTTVYGHLDHFIPELQDYLTDNQYTNRSYEVDLYLPKDKFVVKRGQQIAWSGNTGGSSGPHLHFEIRRTKDEVPVNGLRFKFPIADHNAPEFKNLVVYSMPVGHSVGNDGEIRKIYPVSKLNDTLYSINGVIVGRYDYIGFASEVYDFLDGSTNKCGVYALDLNVDGSPEFGFTVDGISFSLTRYINAHMDYELKNKEHKSVHRLFLLPNNQLPIYASAPDHGIIKLENDSLHKGLIVASDAYGNKSYLKFTFRRTRNVQDTDVVKNPQTLVKWDESRTFKSDMMTIHFPISSLYRDIYFDYSVSGPSDNLLNDTIKLHYDSEPLKKNINIQLNSLEVPEKVHDKVVFSRIDENGDTDYEGGEWFEGKFTLFTRDFGNYVLKVDTVAPVISPVDFTPDSKYSDGQQLVFQVKEDISDIKEFHAYVNNQWVLMVYDPRDQTLTCPLDKRYIHEVEGKQKLKLVVSDNANNVGTYESDFYF